MGRKRSEKETREIVIGDTSEKVKVNAVETAMTHVECFGGAQGGDKSESDGNGDAIRVFDWGKRLDGREDRKNLVSS